MTVCVDSSVALKWVLPEEDSSEARELLAGWRAQGEEMVAPVHFYVEVSSVLRQRTLRAGPDHIDAAWARGALAQMATSGVVVRNLPDLQHRALDLALELAQPTTHDTYYLALAEAEGCEFWTADERLYRAARGRFPWVRRLGEAAPTS